MNVKFHELALEEYDEQLAYHHQIDPKLAARLQAETERVITLILANPLMFRERKHGYRRVNFRYFTHYLVYLIRNDTIHVLSISHGQRRPGHWSERLSDIP